MSEQETRKANDGQWYTWDQFVEYYPNDTNWYWDQACPREEIIPEEVEPEDAMCVMWEDLTSTPGYNAELGKSRDIVVRVNAEWYISEHPKVIALFDKYKD